MTSQMQGRSLPRNHPDYGRGEVTIGDEATEFDDASA